VIGCTQELMDEMDHFVSKTRGATHCGFRRAALSFRAGLSGTFCGVQDYEVERVASGAVGLVLGDVGSAGRRYEAVADVNLPLPGCGGGGGGPERLHEVLSLGVVEGVSWPAHADGYVAIGKQLSVSDGRVLYAAIGVMNQAARPRPEAQEPQKQELHGAGCIAPRIAPLRRRPEINDRKSYDPPNRYHRGSR
jgi:hypothetical protein